MYEMQGRDIEIERIGDNMVYLVLITFWLSIAMMIGLIVFLGCHIRVIDIEKSEMRDVVGYQLSVFGNQITENRKQETNNKDGGKSWYYILCISE
jgi:hypothetical protein